MAAITCVVVDRPRVVPPALRWCIAVGVATILLAGCSSSDDGADSTTTSSSSITSPSSTTVAPSSTPPPLTTIDDALASWLAADPDLADVAGYLGACPSEYDPSYPLDGFCSVEQQVGAGRAVYGLGPPFSEIVAYVLLEESDDGWQVSDRYLPADPYDLSEAPGWFGS